MKIVIAFYEDGTIRHIGGTQADFLSALGTSVKFRASHVEPRNRLLRGLFHGVRSLCDDSSTLAGFTRKWQCRWQVDLALSGGPVLGPFDRRAEAVAAEITWIEQHALGMPQP